MLTDFLINVILALIILLSIGVIIFLIAKKKNNKKLIKITEGILIFGLFLIIGLIMNIILINYKKQEDNNKKEISQNEVIKEDDVICDLSIREKLDKYNDPTNKNVELTEDEDGLFRLQIEFKSFEPLASSVTFFHAWYDGEGPEEYRLSLLEELKSDVAEEQQRVKDSISKIKKMNLPKLKNCQKKVIESGNSLISLSEMVITNPKEKYQEAYGDFINKYDESQKECQQETVDMVSLPDISDSDINLLNQPLICLVDDDMAKTTNSIRDGQILYDENTFEELENIVNSKKYSPLLSKYYLTWRASNQLNNYGASNWSSIPNNIYDSKLLEIYEVLSNYLKENPKDQLAKKQIIDLIISSPILRGGTYGNSVMTQFGLDTLNITEE